MPICTPTPATTEPPPPSLSVIIPAYNEAAFIGATLSRLLGCLKGHPLVEVVVVNNGSTDGTEAIVARFDSVHLMTLGARTTIAKARNIGVGLSASKVLAFIDADVLITGAWVTQLQSDLPRFERTPLLVTGARYELSERPGGLEKRWFAPLIKRGASYLNGGNLVTTRALFDAVGGFSEALVTGEDVDFCQKARAKGATLRIHPGYKTHHEGYPKTVKAFFLREWWHGTGDMQSVAAFIKSRVAMAAVVHSALLGGCLVCCLMARYSAALVAGGAALFLNSGLTVHKFGFLPPRLLMPNIFYHAVYLVARCLSFLRR